MRIRELFEDGRIVKGVNTTPDVDVNSISKEAAKFGFKVDKDGRPQNHPSKVKGSKTNVAFNLGMTEGKMFANPKNTFLTKSDTAYDFIKVGTNLANLKDVPAGSNMDEPDIMIAPYAGAKEMKYLMKQLNRIGYKTQDASGYQDAHYDEEPTGGEAPPQMKAQGPLGKIKLSKLRGVQKERTYEKLAKQLERVLEDDYAPLQIDRKGRVINGHHRLDALRLVGEEYARVHMIDDVVENIAETYADDQREKTKRQLAKHDKAMIKVARDSIKKYEKDKEQKTDENFADGKKFVEPNFDVEWDEATRYPEFKKLGKEAWIELAKKGKAVTIKSAKNINNTDAADPDSFKSLDKNKQARALAQLEKGSVEMPIVALYSDGYKELIGGNTRLTAMMTKDGQATVWAFKVPDEVAENFADGKVNEVLDKPAAYTWSKDQFGFPTATAKELGLNIHFDGRNEPSWEVSFNRKQKDGSVVMNQPTGQGKEFQVFATVKAAILDFMNKYPDTVTLMLDARKDGGNDGEGRVSLYRRMMKQYANKLGWEYDEFDQGGMVTFEISSNPRTDENFADGKVKGKSRPGRVKKSGASCNGSVTELRAKAKKASGERAKMYHWCANMKGGKKK